MSIDFAAVLVVLTVVTGGVWMLDALVLDQNNRFAHLLLPDFIMETNMVAEDTTRIRPGEMIRVKIDHLNPRDDVLRVKQVKG